MAVRLGAGGLQSFDPVKSLFGKKKRRGGEEEPVYKSGVEEPVLKPKEEPKLNTEYLEKREKRTKAIMKSTGKGERAAREQAVVELRQGEEAARGFKTPEQEALIENIKADPSLYGLSPPTPAPSPGQEGLLSGEVSSAEGLFTDIAMMAAGAGVFRFGGKLLANPSTALKAGTAAETSGRVGALIGRVKDLGIGLLGVVGAAKIMGIDVFEGKTDEIQQSINTMGQEASTIVGDVKTGHIDPTVGLKELTRLESSILEMEKRIKENWIANKRLHLSGKIEDVNADIKDALDTLIEGKGDILEFKATGEVPELTPFELNILLRELEQNGYIEKAEFAPFRNELKGGNEND